MTTALNVFTQKKIVSNPDYTVRDNAAIDINQVAASRPPAPFGYKPATTAGLTFGYYGGEMWVDGVLTNIADGTLALTGSTVNYVEATRAGAISKNTTGFTAGQTPLFEITTDSGSITLVNDRRIVNAPLTGRLSLSVAGGAGDTPLTAAQARNDIMEFTGALTGARNIIVPDVARSLTIYNNTSGAYALTVKTAAGTGVAVTQGKRAPVHCDGTNVVLSADDVAATNVTFATATGGTVDAITATFSPALTGYSETIELNVECGGANTSTTPTLNPSALGAKTIIKGSNQALVVGDIPGANFLAKFRYDASLGKYQLLNPAFAVSEPPASGCLLKTIYFSAQTVALTSISNGTPAVLTVAAASQLPMNGSPIQLSTTGTLPTGLALATPYYVINASGTTYNVSATQGGSAIATTGAGSGTHTMNSVYVKNANASYIIEEDWGGGGGGGGAAVTAYSAGAGGGSGGYASKKILAANIGATETITIGAGGTAGANTGGTGGTGGTTSFGAHSSATGGVGGAGSTTNNVAVAGGAGGAGSGGDINLTGNPGGQNSVYNAVAGVASGNGGSTTLGGSGKGYAGASAVGGNGALNSGSGGGGAVGGTAANVGGIGGSGLCKVSEYS